MEHLSQQHTRPDDTATATPQVERSVGPPSSAVALPGLAVAGDRDRRPARAEVPVVRRMKVGGTATPSSVSGTTKTKHVAALGAQAQAAQDGYGSRTFVTDEKTLRDAVDADPHDFAATPGRSARQDVEITVPIHLYEKTNPPPAGMAKGQPVSKTIDGVATLCEVGAEKTGDGKVSITHFKKK